MSQHSWPHESTHSSRRKGSPKPKSLKINHPAFYSALSEPQMILKEGTDLLDVPYLPALPWMLRNVWNVSPFRHWNCSPRLSWLSLQSLQSLQRETIAAPNPPCSLRGRLGSCLSLDIYTLDCGGMRGIPARCTLPPSSHLLNGIKADSNIYFLISQCFPAPLGLALLPQTLK